MFILDIIINIFSNCVWLAVMIVAMIPTLESKISIPLALSQEVWQGKQLSIISAYIFSVIGTFIPAIFVYLLCKFFKRHTHVMIVEKIRHKLVKKVQKNSIKLQKSQNKLKKYLTLLFFVAIPLPLTGVYTASIIAGFSDLNLYLSMISIFVGELISAGITLLICLYFEGSTLVILIITLIMILLFILCNIIFKIFNKLKN